MDDEEISLSSTLSFYSKGQYACIVVGMAVSSFFSVMGSMAISRIAFLKMTSTYQRFLFMLSQMNILNSLFLLLHQFLLPKQQQQQQQQQLDDLFPWAFGNHVSCTISGFFLHFGSLAVAMYSSFLSLYFYFSIHSSAKRDKQPEGIVGFWEWSAHAMAFLIPGGIAVTAAFTNNIAIESGLGLCIINYECDSESCSRIGENEDETSLPSDTSALRWAYLASMAVAAVAALSSTILVYNKVHGTLSRDDSGLPTEMKQRLRAVATQAILYTSVFVNSLTWPILSVVLWKDVGQSPPFALYLLSVLIYPLQGCFNCYIYIRPRYQMLRNMYPDDSMLVVVRVSLSKAGDPDEIEQVRERIYGDKYEPPSIASSVHSIESGLPKEVSFNPHSPLSTTSLVSVPPDDDEMDHENSNNSEAKKKPRLPIVDEGVSSDDDDDDDDDEIRSG